MTHREMVGDLSSTPEKEERGSVVIYGIQITGLRRGPLSPPFPPSSPLVVIARSRQRRHVTVAGNLREREDPRAFDLQIIITSIALHQHTYLFSRETYGGRLPLLLLLLLLLTQYYTGELLLSLSYSPSNCVSGRSSLRPPLRRFCLFSRSNLNRYYGFPDFSTILYLLYNLWNDFVVRQIEQISGSNKYI